MKTTRTLLLCLCLLLAVLEVSSAAGLVVLGPLTRQLTLQPGEISEGEILLRNLSDSPQTVRLYQTDFLAYVGGSRLYPTPGSITRSNPSWIVVTPQQLVVAPKEVASVYYVVQAPMDEDLAGTYWSMLMVEPVPEAALEPPPEAEEGTIALFRIAPMVRYGIRMATHIGQTGQRMMKFADKQLLVEEDKRVLQLDLENIGQRYLRLLVWVELYDEEGASVGRFEGGRRGMYPGCSTRFQMDLSQVTPGNYKALVVADNGDEYVFGARYDLEIE